VTVARTTRAPNKTGDVAAHWTIPAVLIACMIVSILSTDLYTPSLPHLTRVFGTDAGTVQMTMSANFLGYALGPFLIGPLSDRFGRRPLLSWCMGIFAVFSLACALAPTIDFLIAMRVFQGAAASVVSVLGVVIIRDIYKGPDAVRVLSIYGAAIGVAPALGPVIGGWVHVTMGWEANFVILCILGVLVAGAGWVFVPETGRRTPLDWRLSLRRYKSLLSDPRFVLPGLAFSAVFAGLFAYITAGPFLLIDTLGVPTEKYGLYYAIGVVAYIVGAGFANQLADMALPRTMMRVGVAISLIGALIMVFLDVAELISPLRIVMAMSVFSFGLGLTFSSAPLVMLADVPKQRGAAAGVLFGAGQSVGAALGAYSVAQFYDGTATPLVFALLAFTGIAAVLVFFTRPRAGV
jgi:DHA1 family bicyclomycin/chloramphenicol resistance-like MFS transporter